MASASSREDLDFSELWLDTPRGRRLVLIAVPNARIRLGRERLEAIRAGDPASHRDDLLVEAAADWPKPVSVLVFRASAGDPSRSWAFDDTLSEGEVAELGAGVVRGQLRLYRRLVQQGVYALAGTDFGVREHDAFIRGTERVGTELERALRDAKKRESAAHRLDLWLLDHLAVWSSTPFERYVADDLPGMLHVVDRHAQQISTMRAALPDGTLG